MKKVHSSFNADDFPAIHVLIVQSRDILGALWQRHLCREGLEAVCVSTQEAAIAHLAQKKVDIIILDLVLKEGSALAVSDYANYRHPEARVIFVTNTSFFSDGSIFAHAANAQAFLPSTTPPEDLAEMVRHYGGTR